MDDTSPLLLLSLLILFFCHKDEWREAKIKLWNISEARHSYVHVADATGELLTGFSAALPSPLR